MTRVYDYVARIRCALGYHWPRSAHGFIFCALCDRIWSPLLGRWQV